MKRRNQTGKAFRELFAKARKWAEAHTVQWKKYGEVRMNEDWSVDEIVLKNFDVHLEQMSNGSWCLGLSRGKRGRIAMRVNIFNDKERPVKAQCETDDGLIHCGFKPQTERKEG